ncbi:MAG: hypothetical protein AABW82_02630 [Nanoarchaeota archaeon]
MAFNIDFSASAQFKGHNQKPLWLADGRGLFRPSLQAITEKAISRGLDAVVLRSYSHPNGTDNRWQHYLEEAREKEDFSLLGGASPEATIVYRPRTNSTQKPLILVHGQGLQTDKGDIQVLFAERQVGLRKPNYVSNFDYLIDEARDAGEGVIVTASKPYNWIEKDLRKVDAIEIHNGVDSADNNLKAFGLSRRLRIPGIVVSDSKCLADLGTSYTRFRGDLDNQMRYNQQAVSEMLKRELREDISSAIISSSTLSKVLTGLAVLEVKLTGNVD